MNCIVRSARDALLVLKQRVRREIGRILAQVRYLQKQFHKLLKLPSKAISQIT